MKREVIRVVTPGTVLSSGMLREDENNYIASVVSDENDTGLSYCDISTGEISLTLIKGGDRRNSLINELARINAREVIMNDETWQINDIDEIKPVTEAYFNIIGEEYYRADAIRDTIRKQFDVTALLGIGVEEIPQLKLLWDHFCCICWILRKTTSHI